MKDYTPHLARSFDAIRKALGPQGTLQFFAYKQGGEASTPLLEVVSGWKVEQVDALTCKITIAEQEAVTLDLLNSSTRVGLDGKLLYIPENGIQQPLKVPRLWIITAVSKMLEDTLRDRTNF